MYYVILTELIFYVQNSTQLDINNKYKIIEHAFQNYYSCFNINNWNHLLISFLLPQLNISVTLISKYYVNINLEQLLSKNSKYNERQSNLIISASYIKWIISSKKVKFLLFNEQRSLIRGESEKYISYFLFS